MNQTVDEDVVFDDVYELCEIIARYSFTHCWCTVYSLNVLPAYQFTVHY